MHAYLHGREEGLDDLCLSSGCSVNLGNPEGLLVDP